MNFERKYCCVYHTIVEQPKTVKNSKSVTKPFFMSIDFCFRCERAPLFSLMVHFNWVIYCVHIDGNFVWWTSANFFLFAFRLKIDNQICIHCTVLTHTNIKRHTSSRWINFTLNNDVFLSLPLMFKWWNPFVRPFAHSASPVNMSNFWMLILVDVILKYND